MNAENVKSGNVMMETTSKCPIFYQAVKSWIIITTKS
jgi:hypothetical protein